MSFIGQIPPVVVLQLRRIGKWNFGRWIRLAEFMLPSYYDPGDIAASQYPQYLNFLPYETHKSVSRIE